MTIERSGGTYDLVCDICGDHADITFESFYEAVDSKKALGWKSQKNKGEWEDVCVECQEA